MGFAQPGSGAPVGDNFVTKDHQNHLLIVYPKTFQENQPTTKGLSDLADCDIVIVDKFDAAGKPLAFHGARLFGNLARSVRNDIGGQVLGRLKQITSANGNTPWILENFTDQDMAAATPIDAAYRQGAFQPTQNPMQQQQAAPSYAAPPTPSPQQWQPAPQAAAPTPAASPPAWSPQPQPAAPTPQQQWQQPAATPTPPPAPVAAPVIDPGLIAFLAARGINGPFPDQATAEAIAATLQ